MYGLAITEKNGKVVYIEKMNKKYAYTCNSKANARRFFSPGEAAYYYREMMGEDSRVFSKKTDLGVFVVKL